MGMWHDSLRRIPPIGYFLVEIRLDRADRAEEGSWWRKVESYLNNTGMAGLASAWAMARADEATRCSV